MTISKSWRKLDFSQVSRLKNIMTDNLTIYGRDYNYSFNISPSELILSVKTELQKLDYCLKDIRMNGSGASFIVSGDEVRSYNDLDILFNLERKNISHLSYIDEKKRHNDIKEAVLRSLMKKIKNYGELSPSLEEIGNTYLQKCVRVSNNHDDLWSLISLYNSSGKAIELKFVDSMKRKYEFSIDSFQIMITDFLTFFEAPDTKMTYQCFPTVAAESEFGDFDLALSHLMSLLIATRNPEEIRGGGLLKYCYLKTWGYRDADSDEMLKMMRYMCSRFFIDFPTAEIQERQLLNFIANHLASRQYLVHQFVVQVLSIIEKYASCISPQERWYTLQMLHRNACIFAPIIFWQHTLPTNKNHKIHLPQKSHNTQGYYRNRNKNHRHLEIH